VSRGLFLPYSDHVVVHLLQLLLGYIECVRWWVELVCLKGLIGETDLEGLVVLLETVSHLSMTVCMSEYRESALLTCGTFSLSACDEAASVVTDLKAGRVAMGAATLRRSGDAMLLLIVRDSMAILVWM
jgi:hypothetical protein